MNKIVQIAGDSFIPANAYTGPARELRVDTDNWDLLIHDGVTAGGHRVLNEVNADARYQATNTELSGIGPFTTSEHGLLARLGPADYVIRKLAVSSELTIANADGFSGDITLGLATVLAGDHEFGSDVIIDGVLEVVGGINANLSGNVSGGTLAGSTVIATANGDFVTVPGPNFGVRVRSDAGGGASLLQFTSHDGATVWGVISVTNTAITFGAAPLHGPGGFVGDLTGNCSGTAASAAHATTADTAGTTVSAGRWTTPRTQTVSGDAAATTVIDGSGDWGVNLTLANTAVAAGSYGNNQTVGQFSVDSKGRVTAAANIAIAAAGTGLAGILKLATSAQVAVGTDNTSAITAAALVGATEVLGPFTVTNGSGGLTGNLITTVSAQAYLLCTAATRGYNVGDKVLVGSFGSPGGSGGSFGVGLIQRGTTLNYIIGANGPELVDTGTGGGFVASSANFALYVLNKGY